MPVPCLAEELLDLLATTLRELVAATQGPHPRAGVRLLAPPDGDVRLDLMVELIIPSLESPCPLPVSSGGNDGGAGPERGAAGSARSPRPTNDLDANPEQGPMAVLHQGVDP
jgi:hypothetical protein